jgi:hypothetical protein
MQPWSLHLRHQQELSQEPGPPKSMSFWSVLAPPKLWHEIPKSFFPPVFLGCYSIMANYSISQSCLCCFFLRTTCGSRPLPVPLTPYYSFSIFLSTSSKECQLGSPWPTQSLHSAIVGVVLKNKDLPENCWWKTGRNEGKIKGLKGNTRGREKNTKKRKAGRKHESMKEKHRQARMKEQTWCNVSKVYYLSSKENKSRIWLNES